jgi:phosphatidylinositol alpha-mannosyltransferase
MKIAFFSKYLPSDKPSGVSVQVDRLASALTQLGHEVTCFSFSPKSEAMRYKVVQQSGEGSFRLARKFIPALRFREIDKSDFDIYHFHGDDYLCVGSGRKIRTFYGSALFEALHAGKPGRFFYQALFYSLEWISTLRQGTLVAISRATEYALPLVRHVIPCGIPLDRFCPDPSQKSTYPSILFIGDFKSRKRGALLLEIFTRDILASYPDCRLTVIGPESVSAHNVTCRSAVREQELIEEYRRAWVYCLPSSYEGFGVPAIEAMACGTAVVACQNSGTREVINHGKTGLICKPGILGATIKRLIADTAMRNAIVEEGLTRARDFAMVTIARRYEELYNNAVSGMPTRPRHVS